MAGITAFLIIAISTLSQYHKGKTIVLVGVDAYSSPFSISDEKGNLTGFNIDVMDAISKAVGFHVEYRVIPYSTLQDHLQKGRIDAVIAPIDTNNSNNTKYSDYSDPYYVNYISFAVKNDTERYLNNTEDFKGKTICVIQNSTLFNFVRRHFSESTIYVYDDTKTAFYALHKNECIAVVDTRANNEYFIFKNDFKGMMVKALETKKYSQIYRISVQKGNVELADSFSRAIRFMRQNGELDKIYRKWFNRKSELAEDYHPVK